MAYPPGIPIISPGEIITYEIINYINLLKDSGAYFTDAQDKKLNKILKPVIYFLFPEIKNENKIVNLISMNMISNICGIGNAATPAGLKAMEKMQEINRNKKKLSNSMMMLIVLNTTSIQIIPTTVLAIRSALESSNPSNIIIPIWISTIVGTTVGIISMKILIKYNYKISD